MISLAAAGFVSAIGAKPFSRANRIRYNDGWLRVHRLGVPKADLASWSQMLRIGVNALYLLPGVVGGTEIYLRNLLKALAEIDTENEYFIFTNRETGEDLIPPRPNFHFRPQALTAAFRPARILWEQVILPVTAWRHGLDVLLNPGQTAPLACPCPTVTVFHDLQHLRHPEYFALVEHLCLRLLLWGSAHRSRRLIAVSDATRADLLQHYGIASGKITTIHHGVDQTFFELDRTRPESFLLCVSTLRGHKNLGRLIQAFGQSRPGKRLIIVGARGAAFRDLQELITALGLQDSVELTGWISQERLLDLYQRAQAAVYPSLFEGFGMPILEALAARVPLACSDIPPLREVAGEAALYFDPLNLDAITSALNRICSDEPLQLHLAALGSERVRHYTWRRASEATLKAIAE